MKSDRLLHFMFSITLCFILFSAACVKQESNKQEADEEKIINQYLDSHPEFIKTPGGIYYDEQRTGTGLSPAEGDLIIINFAGRYLADMSLRETNYDSLRSEWIYSALYTNYLYGPWKVIYGTNLKGFNEMLGMMKEGGRSVAIFPSNKANLDYRPLLYDVELLAVIKNIEKYDSTIIQEYSAYLQQTYLKTPVYIKDSAIVYLETDSVTVPGKSPTINDTIYFKYTGKFLNKLNGRISDDFVFDSSGDDTVAFIYPSKILSGTMLNKIIPSGIKIALDTMRAGTHAIAVLPYKQAFQNSGLTHPVYKYYIIPAYQTIIYDITVLKVNSQD